MGGARRVLLARLFAFPRRCSSHLTPHSSADRHPVRTGHSPHFFTRAVHTSAVAVMRGVNIAVVFLVGGSLVHYFYRMSWDARQRLLLTANFDPLTHLVNRRRLQDVAAIAIAQFQRHQRPLSVVLCDIDHFKSINDRYGHHAGDDVLVGVAKILTECARTTDNVSRWGGEEFLILLTDTNAQGAQVIAERIRRTIVADPLRSDALEIKTSMTLGVAQITDGETFSGIVARADAALYLGKTGGRNQVMLASPPTSAASNDDVDSANDPSRNERTGSIRP